MAHNRADEQEGIALGSFCNDFVDRSLTIEYFVLITISKDQGLPFLVTNVPVEQVHDLLKQMSQGANYVNEVVEHEPDKGGHC